MVAPTAPITKANEPLIETTSIRLSELESGAPFVQPFLSSPVRINLPPGIPPAFEALAHQASLSPLPHPRDTAYFRDSAAHHSLYRNAHQFTASDAIHRAAHSNYLYLPSETAIHTLDRVALICVTNRPENLAAMSENFRRQQYPNLEIIVVLNSTEIVEDEVRNALGDFDLVTVISTSPETTLGRCLNIAVQAASAPIFAKFDDDDYYGPNYVTDAIIAMRFSRAAVVGKHTFYAHLEATDQRVLRFPYHEFRYVSFVSGATLVVDRTQTRQLAFPDTSLGEDTGFLTRCQRKGLSIFASDRFSFVQNRGKANTWGIGEDQFLLGSTVVEASSAAHRVDS